MSLRLSLTESQGRCRQNAPDFTGDREQPTNQGFEIRRGLSA
jgi:hypothetical protein